MSEQTKGTGRSSGLFVDLAAQSGPRRCPHHAGRARRAFRRLAEAFAANLRKALGRASSKGFHAEALVYICLFNILFMTFLGQSYLAGVPKGTSLTGWLMVLVAFLSNSALLCLVPMLVLAPAAVFARRWWATLIVIPCLYAVGGGLLYADTIIYRLFRMHFSGMILNVLMTPGAGDSVTAGVGTWATSIGIVVSTFAAELGFALLGFPWLASRGFAMRLRSGKALCVTGAVVFCLMLADKTLYAIGDLRDNVEVTRTRYLFPFYQPFTVKRLARNVLGMDITVDNHVRFSSVKGSMDYPRAPLAFRPDGRRPNVLVIGIEGGRFDALDRKVMPFLSSWSEENLVFEEHYSAGNCSRFGLFGLLYGIHGTYWHRVLAERQGPVIVSALADLDYEFRILSCTDLNFPEFRRTAFVDVPEAITDTWDCERLDRDRLMTDEFLAFLRDRPGGESEGDDGAATRPGRVNEVVRTTRPGRVNEVVRTTRPFFAFMFYDASHQPFLYPPEHAVFETDAAPEGLDYVKVARDLSLAVPFRERFWNSLHYIDSQVERVIVALEERGLAQNTLVFVTGDHGEEFCELGLFGHNATFHRYQAKTIMVAHVPGESPRRVRRFTSHVDVVPTIFNYMGVENPTTDYTHGVPLTSPEGPQYVLVAGWDDAAIVDEDAITRFGTEAYNADMTVMDHDYRLKPEQRAERAKRAMWFVEVLEAMRQFVK